jgi:hypothetical protein
VHITFPVAAATVSLTTVQSMQCITHASSPGPSAIPSLLRCVDLMAPPHHHPCRMLTAGWLRLHSSLQPVYLPVGISAGQGHCTISTIIIPTVSATITAAAPPSIPPSMPPPSIPPPSIPIIGRAVTLTKSRAYLCQHWACGHHQGVRAAQLPRVFLSVNDKLWLSEYEFVPAALDFSFQQPVCA